ncbi:MAG: PleD family two-component system response regulator [Desulfobacterales bacterium]|nr:PleD family two-component system response regulator [Desulfobacterales bacterium]MCP4162157.1 PleD family two-component system response regulator [Deltaproteobacteria bacterium]
MTPQNHSILIVDDNHANLGILFDFLSKIGFNILVAEDGESAIEQVEYAPPDIIILDVMMPGIDGFETSSRLKNNKETRDIPIIFMTALADTADKVKGFKAGAVDYITKPIQYEEVLARVTAHLTVRILQKKLEEQNLQLQQEVVERKRAETELQKANEKLLNLANMDGLTQIANRRRFDTYLDEVWRQKIRQQTSLALILIDIDFFKNYNDTYGHQAGDDCLKQIAQAIHNRTKRAGDLVARYGGEEFVVVLPDTDMEEATQVAESIRLTIEELKIPHNKSSVSEYVTLSLGVSSTVPDRESLHEDIISIVDQALYEAKDQGRNRFIMKIFESSANK